MTARGRCVGIVLAGGSAARMGGSPKGLESVGGARIIDRVARALGEAADTLLVVSFDSAAATWLPGVPAIPDRRPGLGPLSGIHAALAHTESDVLVVAWDMPFVPAAALRALRETGETLGADAAAPASNSPWGFEPLAAWYSASALPAVTAMLDASDGRVGAVADHVQLLTVDVSSWGDPEEMFLSVDMPADLERAAAVVARHG